MWFRIVFHSYHSSGDYLWRRPVFIPMVVYMGPVVDSVAKELVFVGVLWLK
jgi:hypothetical protein